MTKSALKARRLRALHVITGLIVAVATQIAGMTAPTQAAVASKPAAPTLSEAQQKLGSLTLPWVPNAGQWDERAAFRAQSFAGSVWVTKDGKLVHQFNGPRASDCAESLIERRARGGEAACPRAPGWVLTERFVGGRIGEITGRAEAIGRVSFSVGPAARHAENLPSYGLVDLGEVYPGVRVELKASQSNVEKLYTVSSGGDPRRIRMAVDGAQALSIGRDGSLIAKTGNGDIAFTAPIAFQEINGVRNDIAVRYALDSTSSHYSFQLAAYDRAHPLVIDPLLQSTYLGGGGDEQAFALAIHPASGEVYVAGQTNSTDLPEVAGGAQVTKGAGSDVFVARFNAALTDILQSTYLGGNSSDVAYALAIHPVSGEVYVTGLTGSSNLPGVAGGAQTAFNGIIDAFVTRFNVTLTSILQSTYLGGGTIEVAYALAIHPVSGEVYVAGYALSTDLPGVAGGAQATKGLGDDAFVSRFNAALTSVLQSTYLGGADIDRATALAIHPVSGEVYVAGETDSTDLPGAAGGAQPTKGSVANPDAFVTRLNATLTSRLQSSYLGGANIDRANALAIHPVSGEIYIAGSTTSTSLPGVAGGAQATKGAGNDAFVTRFNASLTSILQSTYLGGGGNDNAYALAIHPVSGEVLVAGSAISTDLPGVAGGAQATKGASEDAFVTRLNAALTNRLQSSYLGGAGNDYASALAIHPVSGEVLVAGRTDSTDLPGVAGGAQAIKGANTDAFVGRFSLDLAAADVVPNAFVLPAQFGVPVASLRTAGPAQITGLGALAPVTIDGALGGAVCVSTSATCSCNASPGGVFGPSGTIANDQYLCVRHLSAPTVSTFAESRIVVGGYATKFVSFTATLAACLLDMNGNTTLSATHEGLVLVRAMLGFSSANAVAGTGITEAQWVERRTALIACGNTFP